MYQYISQNMILLLLLGVCGCERSPSVTVSPARPKSTRFEQDDRAAKEVDIICQLAMQDFDAEDLEMVYGMPAQSWIKEHLAEKLSVSGGNNVIYLAVGRTENGKWDAPPKSTLARLNQHKVKSVEDANADDLVFFVENIEWVDSNAADVDIGIYDQTIGFHGSSGVPLTLVDSAWRITAPGGCWVKPPIAK